MAVPAVWGEGENVQLCLVAAQGATVQVVVDMEGVT